MPLPLSVYKGILCNVLINMYPIKCCCLKNKRSHNDICPINGLCRINGHVFAPGICLLRYGVGGVAMISPFWACVCPSVANVWMVEMLFALFWACVCLYIELFGDIEGYACISF